MSDKPLYAVLIDLLVAVAAVAGIFVGLKVFRIPNCTAVAKHDLFMWAPRLSVALVAGGVFGFLIGVREASQLSKAIASLALFAAILVWGTYRWKLDAILMTAC